MQDLKIDSQKLMYHVDRLNAWLAGKSIYPIYVEISPCGMCNHRCIFCAFEYLEYKSRFIDSRVLKKTISEMARHKVRSVMFSGEGEPFLHKETPDFILHAKHEGIDVAASCNGVHFTPAVAKKCLGALSWIKVSINAGTAQTYGLIHGCKRNDFFEVLHNLASAVKIRNRNHSSTAIGAQIVLLPENFREVEVLAGKIKKIGADYLVVKPFIEHPSSAHRISRRFTLEELVKLENSMQKYNQGSFKVYFRAHGFLKLTEARPYAKCLGLPFFCEITSTGDIYSCGPFLGNERFRYGNIYQESFSAIWKGKRRKDILTMVATRLQVNHCMKNCRLDESNRYLWDLTHPPAHVNFI